MDRIDRNGADIPLKKSEIVGYGMGGFASTLPNQFKTQFGMSFMTDVAGVSAGVVGILSMAMTIWDAINDPIIGHIADNTNLRRFGRYRPHMIVGALLMAVTLLMMFHVPALSMTGSVVYYGIVLALFSVFFTQFTVPWQALNSVMSVDANQRNRLLAARQMTGAVSTSLVALLTVPLVSRFANVRTGWLCAAGLIAVIIILSALCTARAARSYDIYREGPTAEKEETLAHKLRYVVHNRAVIIAALMLGVVNFAISINAGISMYYMRCVVGDVKMLALISAIQIPVTLIAVSLVPRLLRRFGKGKTLVAAMAVQAASAVLLMFLREDADRWQVIIISLLMTTGLSFANICCFAMLPDCTDYTELHFGSSQAGFVNAICTFVRKLCGSFSSLIIGGLLELVGYAKGLPVMPEWVDMIVNIKTVVPLFALAAVLVLIKLYPITPKYAREMRETLKARRGV